MKYHFDLLEKDKHDLLKSISGLSREKEVHTLVKDHWSVNEILAHLFTAERLSLDYMKKKSLGVDSLKNSGWLESVKIVVLKISQRLPFKYKAPQHVMANTPKELSLEEIQKQWSATRNELKNFLTGIAEKDSKKMIYKHPVAGYLNATQAIIFFREHIRHHLPQIKKIAAS